MYSFVRYTDKEKLIIVTNFSSETTSNFELKLPEDVIKEWNLAEGTYTVKDQLYGSTANLVVSHHEGTIQLSVKPSESFIFKIMP
jgi:hypothetical protein